jgi:hypothetical protein
MIEAFVPWYLSQVGTSTVRCPWAGREVQIRYLTFGGSPVGLIGCSDPDCSMPCLGGACPPDPAREPAAWPKCAEGRVPGHP